MKDKSNWVIFEGVWDRDYTSHLSLEHLDSQLINSFAVGDILEMEMGYGFYGKVRVKSKDSKTVSFEGVGPLRRRNMTSRAFRHLRSGLSRLRSAFGNL